MCFEIGVVTCGPNEALIVSGMFQGSSFSVVVGGRAIVFPCIQHVQRLPLSVMTLLVESPRVYTCHGVAISVNGVAQVRVNGSSDAMIRSAIELFGDKQIDEVKSIALETLEGHQRAIIGKLTVEQIYQDRKSFSSLVHESTTADLFKMGMVVVSYTIKDISDEHGYLKALGLSRISEVQRDARIGEAKAKMEASVAEAEYNMNRLTAVYSNNTDVALAKRDFEIKKAAYDVEVNTAAAEAELAYQLQAATMKQKIEEQQSQIKVVERMQEIELQEQEIQRKSQELEAMIRKPAEAEKYRMETIAAANHKQLVMEAEAEAEAMALKGEAMAFAIETKAKADAEQMAKKAEAFKEYNEAARVEMILKTLPKIAAEISAPLSQAKKITMVSDGEAAMMGAAKISGEVLQIMNSVPDSVRAMTGIEFSKLHTVSSIA